MSDWRKNERGEWCYRDSPWQLSLGVRGGQSPEERGLAFTMGINAGVFIPLHVAVDLFQQLGWTVTEPREAD